MPKMVVYELFEIEAKDPDTARLAVEKKSKRDSVIVAAESINQLPHPSHLQAVIAKFPPPVAVDLDDDEQSLK